MLLIPYANAVHIHDVARKYIDYHDGLILNLIEMH